MIVPVQEIRIIIAVFFKTEQYFSVYKRRFVVRPFKRCGQRKNVGGKKLRIVFERTEENHYQRYKNYQTSNNQHRIFKECKQTALEPCAFGTSVVAYVIAEISSETVHATSPP